MIRVGLVISDDHVAENARRAIQSEPGLCIAAEVGGQERVWAALRQSRTDVVVVHLEGGATGDEGGLIRGLLDKRRNCSPVVVMSSRADEEYAVKLLRRGVMAYVLTGAAQSELATAVRAVHQSRRFTCPLIRDALASKYMDLLGDGAAL